jgi:hypothetical protein
MNKLYLLLVLSAFFQACGIMGAMKNADESKSFWKGQTALYNDRNVKRQTTRWAGRSGRNSRQPWKADHSLVQQTK